MRVMLLVNRGLMATSLNIHGGVWAQTPFLDSLAAESLIARNHFSETPDNLEVRKIWSFGLKDWPKSAIQRFLIAENKDHALDWPGVGEPTVLRPGRWRASLQKAVQAAKPEKPFLLIVETDFLFPPWEEAALSLADPGPALGEDEDLDESFEELAEDDDEEDQPEENPDSEGAKAETEEDELSEEEEEEEKPEPIEPMVFQTGPIDPESPEFRRLQTGRGLMLAAWDEEVQMIYEMVDQAWSPGPWALLITSDTGYPLGEAGNVGPDEARPLHQETLRVPLILHAPDIEPGSAVRDFTGHGDLASWLAQARNWQNKNPSIPPFLGKPQHFAKQGEKADEWAALRTHDATLIARTSHQEPALDELKWYEQPEDMFEINDLAQREPDRVNDAYQILREWINPVANPGGDLP